MRLQDILRRLTPLYRSADGGSGGGAGPASPGGGAAAGNAGTVQPGSGQPGSGGAPGGGAAAPFRLSDDATVDLGEGRTGRWGDLRDQHYMPRERFDAGVTLLTEEAKRLEQAWTRYHAGQGQQPRQPDPAAAQRDQWGRIKAMPIVDGNTLSDVYETLQREGLQPIAKVVQQLVTRLSTVEGQLKTTGEATRGLTQNHQNERFRSWVSGEVLGKLETVKGLPEGVTLEAIASSNPAAAETLRQLVEDTYLSHDQESWRSSKEVRDAVTRRLEGMIALVTTMQQSGIKLGQERKRRAWTDLSKGRTVPSGDAPYTHKRGDELARMLYGAAEGATT